MKTNKYRINYGTSSRNVQLKIDETFAERVIPADDGVRLIDEIVEEMDLSPLMSAYKRTGRRPSNTLVTMLKVLLYAAMENIYSCRIIASACVRDINFIWLLNGELAPSYHAIARFRSERLAGCMQELAFYLDCYIELYQRHPALLGFNANFDQYIRHEHIPMEDLRDYSTEWSITPGNFPGSTRKMPTTTPCALILWNRNCFFQACIPCWSRHRSSREG